MSMFTLCFLATPLFPYIPDGYMSNMVYKIAHCSQKQKGAKQINWLGLIPLLVSLKKYKKAKGEEKTEKSFTSSYPNILQYFHTLTYI